MTADLVRRTTTLEGTVQALRRRLAEVSKASGTSPSIGFDNRGRTGTIDAVVSKQQESMQLDTKDGGDPIAVSIHHRVRWECRDEFKRWQVDIISAMSKYEGYLSCRLISPDENEMNPELFDLYTVIFKFDTLPHLQTWMLSQDRKDHLASLQQFLAAPDEVAAAQERQLPNEAFTDVSCRGTPPTSLFSHTWEGSEGFLRLVELPSLVRADKSPQGG